MLNTYIIVRVVKFFYLFSVACALAALTACGSKDAQEQENIPDATVYTHVDSLVIGAGMMGDFDRTLASATVSPKPASSLPSVPTTTGV